MESDEAYVLIELFIKKVKTLGAAARVTWNWLMQRLFLMICKAIPKASHDGTFIISLFRCNKVYILIKY